MQTGNVGFFAELVIGVVIVEVKSWLPETQEQIVPCCIIDSVACTGESDFLARSLWVFTAAYRIEQDCGRGKCLASLAIVALRVNQFCLGLLLAVARAATSEPITDSHCGSPAISRTIVWTSLSVTEI